MNLFFRNTLARPGAIIALALAATLSGGAAHAAGTAAGTAITNLATLTYSVGATAQSPIGSSATGNLVGAGTATSLLVDNKINLQVARVGSTFVSVVPGTNGVAAFTVTNTGNSVQDFSLSAANLASGSLSGVNDNFDAGTCSAVVESGATGGYQAGEDTATFIDELASDANKTVYVVCPIALSRVNNDGAVISLTATALEGGAAGQGAALVQTTGANTAGVDIVFADGAGTDDAARDARHSAQDVFKVVTAKLTVTKTVAPVCDPFNGDANPKNIPGSFVRYTISIANTGNDTATLTQITDALTASVAIDANLITGVGTAAPATTCSSAAGTPTSAAGSGFLVTGTRASFPKYYTTTSSVDGVDFVTPNITVDFSLVLPNEAGYLPGHLKAGETVSVIYQVKIN